MQPKGIIVRIASFLPLMFIAQTAHSQSILPIEAGDKVRVTLAERQVVGTVERVSSRSIVLVAESGESASSIDLWTVRAVEKSEPRSRLRGAFIGAGTGLLASAILAGALEASCSRSADCWGGLATLWVVTNVTGPLILTGTAIGVLLPPGHRWRDVPLRASLGAAKSIGQPGGGVTLRLQW